MAGCSRSRRSARPTWSPKSIRSLPPHQLLVGRVARGQLGLLGGRPRRVRRRRGRRRRRPPARSASAAVLRRRDVLVARPADERHQRVQEAGRVAERAVSVQRQLEEVLAQEDHLLGSREDGRAVREPGLQGVLAQQPIAPGVEGADDGVGVAVGHQRSTRSVISSAARSVKVSARISDGLARFSAISQAMRRVITVVLPVPAPATIRSGPSPWVTALRWRGGQVGQQRAAGCAGAAAAAARGGATSSSKIGIWFGDGTTAGISPMVAECAIHRTVIARLLDTSCVAQGDLSSRRARCSRCCTPPGPAGPPARMSHGHAR